MNNCNLFCLNTAAHHKSEISFRGAVTEVTKNLRLQGGKGAHVHQSPALALVLFLGFTSFKRQYIKHRLANKEQAGLLLKLDNAPWKNLSLLFPSLFLSGAKHNNNLEF